MSHIKTLGKTGTRAVRTLRASKLKRGYPFMINTRELPSNQCYLEFPGGKIVLVTLSKSTREFTALRELSYDENIQLRKKFDLEEVI